MRRLSLLRLAASRDNSGILGNEHVTLRRLDWI